MNAEDSVELFLPVQVRDLPRARVAQVGYTGPAGDIGEAFERVNRFVLENGIGPCGPLIGVYDRIGDPGANVHGIVQVPVTRLLENGPHGDIDTVRLDRIRAASLMFHGPMGPDFRQAHFDLFAWMDTQGLPRAGTAHQHAYIAGTGPGSEWTVEIRVPIVGGLGPGLAV